MKQNSLVKQMYKACLSNDKQKITKLKKAELEHIIDKRQGGKKKFSAKWIVTDF